MPKMNGIEATQKAMELIPDLKIIAYTMYGEGEYFAKMIELGVKGFILKSSGISDLEKAIASVMNGENYFMNGLLGNFNNSGLNKDERSSQIIERIDKKLAN